MYRKFIQRVMDESCKIMSCINSAETEEHFIVCQNLSNLFADHVGHMRKQLINSKPWPLRWFSKSYKRDLKSYNEISNILLNDLHMVWMEISKKLKQLKEDDEYIEKRRRTIENEKILAKEIIPRMVVKGFKVD